MVDSQIDLVSLKISASDLAKSSYPLETREFGAARIAIEGAPFTLV